MGCFLGCIRLILVLVNVILFAIFFAVGILGLLLKFNSQFISNLLEKATTKWQQKELQDVVQFIQQYGSGLAIGFIVLGLTVAIIALVGLFALLCKNRFLGFIYLSLLTILSMAELGLIIYLFAIPQNLDKVTFKLLGSSFEHLRTNDSLTGATYTFWSVLGLEGGKPCCGLDGYQDFNNMLSTLQYPPSCCKNSTLLSSQTCNKTMAGADRVEGCKGKISKFLNEYRSFIIGSSCGISAFQIMIVLAVCSMYKKWKVEN